MTSWTRTIGCSVAAVAFAGCASAQARQELPIWMIERRPPAGVTLRPQVTGPHAIVRFNKPAFDALMAGADLDTNPATKGVVLTLPLPDGTFERFLMKESPTIDPALSKAFPEIRTYSGQGLDDGSITARIGWTSAGFHALILAGERGSIYIDPYGANTLDIYVSYRKGGDL